MSAKKVLCFEPFADSAFLEAGFEVVHAEGKDKDGILKAAQGCEGILTRTEKIDAEIMSAVPELKIIARFGAGFDNIDVEAATKLGIWVTNAPNVNIDAVSEGAIYMILALGRKFGQLERDLRAGGWELRNKLIGSEIAGKSLGIIGIGRIGRVVAEKAIYGLSMNVCAYDPYVPQEKAPEKVKMISDWDEIFSSCDFVSIHMPYMGKTMVNEHEFSIMKPTAFFLNLARGPVVDEPALIKALQSREIAGAGLDVFSSEPPTKGNPLLQMDNVVVLPHCTGISAEQFDRSTNLSSRSIIEAILGKEPSCAVNHPVNPRNML